VSAKIAKIVKSNSHVDYVARVIDALDSDAAPAETDYGFAQFVSIPLVDTEIIGVIYKLPRLSIRNMAVSDQGSLQHQRVGGSKSGLFK